MTQQPTTQTPLVDAVVLAAGKGTRMRSDKPKVLHEIAGRPLLDYVLATAREAGIDRNVVVVGHRADQVRAACRAPDLTFVLQEPQLGTGHAVQMAAPLLRPRGWTVVLAGDVPLLRAETLRRLIARAAADEAAAVVLTCVVPDAGAYGRIVKDPQGNLLRIVEARDATAGELAIGEYNSGVYCFRTERLQAALEHLTTANDQGEYYLTDTIGWLVACGDKVRTVTTDDPGEVVGINTVAELAAAEHLLAARRLPR
ncbi:MAG: NTP transferase domain-containing protein [Candidatus Krumholzibacteria bacterium]|nr:NTP transferase domain-containing protein [Candidatus Krumholzibacteria bacterium]